MITSDAPGHVIARIRRAAGPNPESSKLTEKERLHLIYMVGAMSQARNMNLADVEEYQSASIRNALIDRGMSADQVAETIRRYERSGDVVAWVNTIATHPDMHTHHWGGCST